ncbi:acyl-CoA synthetase (AMP-forming)/AMP-acid ligase II [Bradyrhizobium elkanii]
MMQALTDHPRWASADLSALKAICTGSTMVPQRLVERFARRGVPVLQVYGATETSPIAVYTKLGADLAPDGASGLPGLCCEAAIIDDVGTKLPPGTPGEIVIRGPNVFCGYWGDQQATREAFSDGWYRTGDIGRCDADGYFWVRDRKKNLIISGGENIYPAEVERVLMGHPDVAECAVVGRRDPRWDEVPIAYVVRRPGSRIAAEALLTHVQSQLARFKVPREIIFTHELPKTALGKVQHFMLKELDTQSSPEGDSD